MAEPLLEALRLKKAFDGLAAVDDVSLTIAERELVGIIGANGAGKTTFVNIVTGYLKPDSGQVRFRGGDITRLTPREITRLGIVRSFQVAQLFPDLTVLDNALIALAVAARTEGSFFRPLKRYELVEQVFGLLRGFAIDAYAAHKTAALPQGVRKLLDIAMAMSGRPRLVLLDEPTSGVSKDEKFLLMDRLLEALVQSGASVLFIEHDMELVERYAQRLIAFNEGRVIADGAPAAVLADPQVRAFVGGAPGKQPQGERPTSDALA